MPLFSFFRTDPCNQHYTMTRVLGQGSFATVKRAKCKKDQSDWAVKIISKKALGQEDVDLLQKEVSIMEDLSRLRHPNIVRLREVFDCKDYFYMVMELCTGGEVFDRIVEKENYSETEARVAVRQVVEAIKVCHDHGIVHRDLKPENLLYVSSESDMIKLADFGLANILDATTALLTACGTPGYVAPEVIKNRGYSKSVDLWSIGIILYILLCGFPPFYDENQAVLFGKIQTCDYAFTRPFWDKVSDGAKSLVSRLLVIDPHGRATAEQVLSDPWMTCNKEMAPLEGFRQNMVAYNAKRKFKASITKLQVVARLSMKSSGGSTGTERQALFPPPVSAEPRA